MYKKIKISARQVRGSRYFSTGQVYDGKQDLEGGYTKIKDYDDIPGPKSYPVVGTLYKYLPFVGISSMSPYKEKNTHGKPCMWIQIPRRHRGEYDADALDKIAWLNWQRYGDLVRETPGVRVLHVFDPEDMETVLRQDDRHPARRSHLAMQQYRLSKPEVYNTGGLLATNGPDWWRLRSAFQKNFTSPQSVKNHIESTDVIVREFVQWIEDSKVSHHDDFLTYLNRLNLEVIGEVAFRERFRSFSEEEQDPSSRSSRTIAAAFGSNSGIMRLDKGFLWKLFKTPLYKKLVESQEYLEKVATDILMGKTHFFEKEMESTDKSLLQSFLLQPNVDLKDIIGMMVDILMAAIDTTSYSTSFALYHLAKNPECQEKLFREVLAILPTKDTPLTPEMLSKVPYTRSCIKESLRLNPVSIGIGRTLQKDIVIKGFRIPKDTVIVTQNMLACRLPQNVRNPLSFNPERWLRDSPHHENLHPFLSLPFGYGPRSCIARRLAEQNMSITLIRMVRAFRLDWKGKNLGIQTLLINKPDKPISLSFKTRS